MAEVTGKEGCLSFFPTPCLCLFLFGYVLICKAGPPRQRAWITNSLTVTLISYACHLILCLEGHLLPLAVMMEYLSSSLFNVRHHLVTGPVWLNEGSAILFHKVKQSPAEKSWF